MLEDKIINDYGLKKGVKCLPFSAQAIIHELEKENATLKSKLDSLCKDCPGIAYLEAKLIIRNGRILELEQELLAIKPIDKDRVIEVLKYCLKYDANEPIFRQTRNEAELWVTTIETIANEILGE